MIKVTVRCSFCTRTFTPIPDPRLGDLVMLDVEGKLCCDDCLHPACGYGHVTDADADTCEAIMSLSDPSDEDAYGDPDMAYEQWRNMLELST